MSNQQEIGSLLRHPDAGRRIKGFLGKIPYLSVSTTVQPITRGILRVGIQLVSDFEWHDRLHGTVEPFWLWVEDNESEKIYHSEYVLLHKKQVR